jgi:hypothetical protein
MDDREKNRPLHSTRADDAALGDAIEAFVVGLAERIDRLQDLEIDGDLTGAAALARQLADDAEQTGFGPVACVAGELESACLSDKRDEVHEQLLELTDLARRVRLGHPGAL